MSIGAQDPVLVVFHLAGCPYCKAVVGPGSICRDLAKVHLLEIGADHHLGHDLQIQAFPTMLLVLPNQTYQYNGARTKEALSAWIQGKLQGTSA